MTTNNNRNKIPNVPNLRFPEFKEEWKESRLGDVVYFSKERIFSSELNNDNYISTENMLQDFNGITVSKNIPLNVSVFAYAKGDTLLSNIRPYLKKVWKADRNGGCSSDVFVIKANTIICNKDFAYYLIANECFISYVMCGTKGVKMPRGDKEQMKLYKISYPTIKEQQKIANLFNLLDERIETQSKIIEDLKTLINGVRSYIFTHQNNCSKHSLGDFLTEYSERNREKQLPSVAVGKYGIRKREEIYSKELSNDYSNNKIIYKDTLTIGMGSSQIDIGILLDDVEYCVSPAYTTYKIHDINSVYLQEYLKLINPILSFKYMITSVRQGKSVNKEELMQHKIFVCSSIEQKAIEQKFSAFYKKLEIEQNLLNALVSQKKYLLQQMFI